MIQPSPTSSLAPGLSRGVLVESRAATATNPPMLVMSLPNSNYQLHLIPKGNIAQVQGGRMIGRVCAEARRVDLVRTGGAFIEPVIGRPRRVQGRVIGGDDETRTLIVDAATPVHCRLGDARQRPSDFPVGEMVSFDVLDGASFEASGGAPR